MSCFREKSIQWTQEHTSSFELPEWTLWYLKSGIHLKTKDFMSHPLSLVFTKLGLLAKLGSQDNVLQRGSRSVFCSSAKKRSLDWAFVNNVMSIYRQWKSLNEHNETSIFLPGTSRQSNIFYLLLPGMWQSLPRGEVIWSRLSASHKICPKILVV